jgi:hypothetical protein
MSGIGLTVNSTDCLIAAPTCLDAGPTYFMQRLPILYEAYSFKF